MLRAVSIYFSAFIIACIISASLFLIMSRLISSDNIELAQAQVNTLVDISQLRETDTKTQESQAKEPEPELPPVAINLSNPSNNTSISIDLAIDTIEWQSQEMHIEQKYWSQPISANMASGADYIGEADTGLKEIVPVSTQRPNIPQVAYDNKTDGWVLLAYTVMPTGRIKDIRIMPWHCSQIAIVWRQET